MTANVNPEQAKWLLSKISGSDDGPEFFMTLPVQGKFPWSIKSRFSEIEDELVKRNQHSSIHFAINRIDGDRRTNENVSSIRSLFLDLDGTPLDEIQVMIRDGGRTPPHAIIETSPERFHCYWLVKDCDVHKYTSIQKALANRFGGDGNVADPARIARLPGFYHQKLKDGILSKPFLSKIIYRTDSDAYSLDELISGLGLNLSKDSNVNWKPSSRFDIRDKLHDGQRTEALTKFSGRLIREGLSDEEAIEILVAWNAAQCDPPLPDIKLIETFLSIRRGDNRRTAEVPDEIDNINQNFAVTVLGGKTTILRDLAGEVDFFDAASFKLMFCDQSFEGRELGTAWLKHPKRRKLLKGIEFVPQSNHVSNERFNLFRGYGCVPLEGDCNLFLEHLKHVICSGDETSYGYFLDWLSDMFQNTSRLPGVAIVMKGARGAGKSLTANIIGSLWHRAHYKQVSNSEHIIGRFNGHMKDCLLCFADEALFAADKRAEQQLKMMITEPRRIVEIKGKDAFEVDNFTRMIMATNSEWSIPAGMDERRYFVLDVSDKFAQNHKYFEALTRQMEQGGREALLHLLLNRKITCNVRQAPKTKALLKQKIYSLDSAQAWIFDCLSQGSIGHCDNNGQLTDKFCPSSNAEWPKFAVTELLYEKYLAFAHEKRERFPVAKNIFVQVLVDVTGAEKFRPSGGDRKRGYLFPDLEECRLRFSQLLQQEIDWEG